VLTRLEVNGFKNLLDLRVDFGGQLDPTGPVTRLASGRRFVDDMTAALLQAQRASR
jgi:hypothetical protein